jgi:hypothetical protein
MDSRSGAGMALGAGLKSPALLRALGFLASFSIAPPIWLERTLRRLAPKSLKNLAGKL